MSHSIRRAARAVFAFQSVLLALASAPLFSVNGQEFSPKGQHEPAGDSPAYVIYQTPEGDVTCREATREEAEGIRRDGGVPLRQINHLKRRGAQPDATGAGLTIILRGTDQLNANPAAKQAFINAAAKWEALISDPITIHLDVDYGTTSFGTAFSSSTVLGVTSSSNYLISYTGVRQRLISHAPPASEEAMVLGALPSSNLPTNLGTVTRVAMPVAIMRALGVIPANPQQDTQTFVVPKIGFNSAFGFDFDPSDGVTAGQTDFDSVAVHEIGHALGFNSQAGSKELNPDAELLASVWDLYRFEPGTTSLANFSTSPRVLSSGPTATDRRVQFNGGVEVELSTGKPNGTGGDGNQSSHWKDDGQGVPYIGIMDPTIRRGIHYQITAHDQRALDFMGYSVGPVVVPPAPDNDLFSTGQQLAGASGRVTGTNVGATKEPGEPSHSPDGNAGGKSVWYRWQAPASGTAMFTTGVTSTGGASDFDTVLGVYAGSAVNGLTPIARNDDLSSGNQASAVQFNAVAGTVYHVAVDGWNAEAGNIALGWSLASTPSAPTIQFASPAVSVDEGAGGITVGITRTGDTQSAVTVGVRTVDNPAAVACADTSVNIAFARCDYATTVETLSFAPGETAKPFTVPLIDDAHVEPGETVQIALSNPTGGASLGAATMTLTITSNDAPNQPNPIRQGDAAGIGFFVRQQYLDFLSREPEAGEPWSGTLAGCADQFGVSPGMSCDRIQVSLNIFSSPEFQVKGAYVFRFYRVSFTDPAAPAQVGYLPAYDRLITDMRLVTGTTAPEVYAKKAAFADAFVQRPEFTSVYGAMNNASFVDTLMNRYGLQSITTPNPASPDTGPSIMLSRADLVGALNAATLTRAQAVRAIADSSEVSAAERNPAFIAMQYYGYLRRRPESGGYIDWLNHFAAHPDDYRSMVNGFINSAEYRLRFGQQ